VLSTYPPPFVMENGKPQRKPWEDGLIFPFEPSPNARISLEEPAFIPRAMEFPSREPVKTWHMAGGFFFTLGSYAEEVLPDPFIYFSGEEHGVAIRAFTHGWDIFTPKHVPLYHLYREQTERTHTLHWSSAIEDQRRQSWLEHDERSVRRLRRLFFGSGLPGVYGLGRERTLDDFRISSGIDYPRMSLPGEERQAQQGKAAISPATDLSPVAILAPLAESAEAARYLVLQCMLQSRLPDLIVIVQRHGEAAHSAIIDDLRSSIHIAWLYLQFPVSDPDAYRIALAHALDAGAEAIFLCDTAQSHQTDFVASGVAALADTMIAFAEKRTAQMRGPTTWSERAAMPGAIEPACLTRAMAERFGLAMAADPDRPPRETLYACLSEAGAVTKNRCD
jgi:hypothetical protein